MTTVNAIAVFDDKKIQGTVRFTQHPDHHVVTIDIDVKGLKRGQKHGFHVHQYGDMSDHCTSMCDHFNPYEKTHGGPLSKTRHVGDLGNLHADATGRARCSITDAQIRLTGTARNIIGRGLIIHEGEDDLGMGGNELSKKTGNAGARIACAVIGYARPVA